MILTLPNRDHFTIGEVAKAFDVNTSLIRYWQSEFDILNPKKDKRGQRRFEAKDIETLKLIYSLVKEQGFTLEGAKDYFKKKLHKLEYKHEVVTKLEGIKEELLKIKSEL